MADDGRVENPGPINRLQQAGDGQAKKPASSDPGAVPDPPGHGTANPVASEESGAADSDVD